MDDGMLKRRVGCTVAAPGRDEVRMRKKASDRKNRRADSMREIQSEGGVLDTRWRGGGVPLLLLPPFPLASPTSPQAGSEITHR